MLKTKNLSDTPVEEHASLHLYRYSIVFRQSELAPFRVFGFFLFMKK